MSDTPRMESALMDAPEVGLANVWKVGCDIERELNAANDRIKRLEEELMDAKDKHAVLVADVALYEDKGERIKRLEEAGDKLHWAWMNPFDPAGETIVNNWRKAKEDKL